MTDLIADLSRETVTVAVTATVAATVTMPIALVV